MKSAHLLPDPPLGERVRVYYDSTRRTWSVVRRGVVVWKSNLIRLTDCRFVVRDSIRDRVRRTGQKDPHAYVEGVLASPYAPLPQTRFVRFRYNPMTTDRFETAGGIAVDSSAVVALSVLQEGRLDLRAYGVRYLETGNGKDG